MDLLINMGYSVSREWERQNVSCSVETALLKTHCSFSAMHSKLYR